MDDFIIRRLTADDIFAMTEIEKRCFSVPWSRASFAASMMSPISCWIGAFDGENLIAYIGAHIIFDEAEILNVATDISYRRRGAAKRLLGAMLKKSEDVGVAAVFLDVRESNVGAIKLYESFGFKTYAVRSGYYTDPVEAALEMKLDLTKGTKNADTGV